MDVRMPDGTVVQNVPDGMTQAQVMARYQPVMAKNVAAQNDPGALGAAAISAGSVMDRAAAGLRMLVPGPIRNAVDSLNNKLGMGQIPTPESTAAAQPAMASLEDQHPAATMVGGVVPYLGMGPEAAGVMAATEIGSPAERLTRGLTMFGGGKLLEAGAGKLGDYLANKAADVSPQAAEAARAVDAGYKIAPNEAGQQSPLQWVGGQIKTQQAMASKNIDNTTRLAAQEVGLPADQPITRAALDSVRGDAGKAYDAVKNAQPTIPTDPTMQAVAQHIENNYTRVTQSFKSLRNPEVETLIGDLKNPAFDSEGLVEAVKQFRNDGNANMASPKPSERALGRVQLQAQDALESLIDRTLTAAGQPDAVSALQAARQTIAKTYSIQGALDANGNVVASKLAKQLENGKPLSGNLKLIGQTAAAFPKSLQHFQANPPAFSPLDMMAAAMTGGKEALLFGARPIARGVLSSGPYQNNFIGANAPNISGLLGGALQNPALDQSLGGLLGPAALQAYQRNIQR